MGVLKVKWSEQASERYLQILLWYQENLGTQFALKFSKGILDTVDLLAKMPTIGMIDERHTTSKNKYYSFLSHPKFRITYRYTKTTLYVVAIRATMMKHN